MTLGLVPLPLPHSRPWISTAAALAWDLVLWSDGRWPTEGSVKARVAAAADPGRDSRAIGVVNCGHCPARSHPLPTLGTSSTRETRMAPGSPPAAPPLQFAREDPSPALQASVSKHPPLGPSQSRAARLSLPQQSHRGTTCPTKCSEPAWLPSARTDGRARVSDIRCHRVAVGLCFLLSVRLGLCLSWLPSSPLGF